MNAIRRLEEFILKLNAKQNEPALLNKINEVKLTSHINDLKMSETNSHNNRDNQFSCSIDKRQSNNVF